LILLTRNSIILFAMIYAYRVEKVNIYST
jgi:hypothetical protein